MKQIFTTLCLSAVLCLAGIANLWAHDFEVNGIFYNHVGGGLDVAVTECDGKYSGNITIPAEVLYDNNLYNVVTIEDEAFWKCYGLTAITISEGVSHIGKSAFRYCSHLGSVIIPESMESIGEYAFDGCYSLTTINLPNSIKRIPHSLFRGCESLDNITLPENINFIGNEAFSKCASLSSIAIPEGISSFGNESFFGCNKLADVTNLATTPQPIYERTFTKYGTLHVLPGCGDAYRAANVWKNFTIVEDAEDPSGIADIQGQNPAAQYDVIYSISGARRPALQKGLNIIGGKKILVK